MGSPVGRSHRLLHLDQHDKHGVQKQGDYLQSDHIKMIKIGLSMNIADPLAILDDKSLPLT